MKKRVIILSLFIVASLLLISFSSKPHHPDSEIAYPEGFRNWIHVRSNIVSPANPAAPKYEGFTHIYTNEKGLAGYKTGQFPDGAIIVFDVVERISTKNAELEGKRKFIDVMVKDSKKYSDTGGWGFQEFFDSTGKVGVLTAPDQQKCFSCHTSQKQKDFVFTKYRE